MKKIINKLIILIMLITLLIGGQAFATTGEEVAEYAKQFVGYPYGWGREGTDSYACGFNHWNNGKKYDLCFDCSGFMQYVYGKLAILQTGK